MRRKRTRPVTTDAAPATVYRDKLLRVLLVVERGGRLYLVPRRPDGWQARQEIAMTDAARSERLTVARDVTPGELGIPSEKTGPQDAPESTRTGQRDP